MSDNTATPVFPQARMDQMAQAARDVRNDILSGKYALPTDRFDGIASRLDDATSAFFARQLEFMRPGILEVLYPELKGTQFVPVETNIDKGAEQWTVTSYDKVGKAKISKDMAGDHPRVDIKGSQSTFQLYSLTNSYGYTIQEARAAMMAGLPLVPRKAMTAREVIERQLDDIIFNGEASVGLKGILNLSSTDTYTTPSGALGSQSWDNKNADEILKDLNGAPNQVVKNTLGIEIPDFWLLPLSRYNVIAAKRVGDGTSVNVLEYFLKNNPYVKSVEFTHKSETSGSGSSARGVCYRRDPQKLQALMPVPFEQFAPQFQGLEVITICHARTGGVVAHYPAGICYADHL